RGPAAGTRARAARLRLGARGSLMSAPALPTNRDENWRYANLRPLAKARIDAVAAPETTGSRIELPAVLPGFERWVFVDGRFDAANSTRAPDSCAELLSFGAAGETLAAMLDTEIETAGVDFALARLNGAPGDGAEARIELNFVSTTSAAAGTSYPRVQVHCGRGSHLHLVERHLGSGAADAAINAAFDVALRADAQLDHCRLLRHPGGTCRGARHLSPAHRDLGRPQLPFDDIRQTRRA